MPKQRVSSSGEPRPADLTPPSTASNDPGLFPVAISETRKLVSMDEVRLEEMECQLEHLSKTEDELETQLQRLRTARLSAHSRRDSPQQLEALRCEQQGNLSEESMIDRLANIQSKESILEAAHQDLSTIASRLQEAAGRSNRIVKRKAEIQDINHESSTPFRNKVADGDLVQSALQVLSCSVQASKRDRNPSSDLTMATENAAVDCAVSMQADLNREVDYGELMIVDSDGNTIIDCMGVTAVDSKTATLGIMVTPTVDSDAAKTACAVSTTVDHNSKSEIDHVAGNTLNEPVYPGGRLGIPHQAGNIIPIEIVAETQAHLRCEFRMTYSMLNRLCGHSTMHYYGAQNLLSPALSA